MHKNSQKRIYDDYIYFITSCIDDKADFFREKLFCELWINELMMAKEIHKFLLYAFCLNYNHFHLLIKPNNEIANYSEIVKFIKRNFSRDANKIMGFSKWNDFSTVCDISQCRIKPNINEPARDIPQCRIKPNINEPARDIPQCRKPMDDNWDCGNHGDNWDCRLRGHRNDISILRNEFIQKYGTSHNLPKFKWQKSFHDHIIRNENDFNNHWNYTMHNFKKHNLPDDWRYTGLNFPEIIDEI